MLPGVLTIASGILGLGESPSALGTTLALIITFVLVMGGVVNGLVVYIVAQVMVERRQNQERQQSLD
jgi:phage shock protein PspC (stress-responsive transcriptional regulator)